tara:strand:+ start:6474 stop:6812 length:339 start_codon:yes stop_codon:yes gene_type:complete
MDRVVCKLGDLNEYQLFIKKYKYVLIKAGATWCGPCQRIKELFNSLAYKMPEEFVVGLIDIDDAQSIKRKLNIKSVPYFATIINGEVADVLVGSDEKQIQGLFNKCKKAVGN